MAVRTTNLAFPNAKGAGAYTIGGSGQTVYHVTNLNDSGAGSFRDAVSQSNRTIVFDVSGVINLGNHVGSGSSNLTVAGQTAPEGGITIVGNRCYFENMDNLLVRYIRFRGGKDADDKDGKGRDSYLSVGTITNQMFDHCSFSFGTDEAASWYATGSANNVFNITVQNCLFAESKTGTIVGGLAGTVPTVNNITVVNNLWYNISHRFPNTAGDNANIEVINNAVWGVSARLVRGNGNGLTLNHQGNYYDYGTRGINDDRVCMYAYETGYPSIYSVNNKLVASSISTPLASTLSEMNVDNTLMWKHFIDGTTTPQGTRDKGDQLETEYFTNTEPSSLGESFNISTADEALEYIKKNVGCNARLNGDGTVSSNLDTLDTQWLNNVKNSNYVTALTESEYITPTITSISRDSSYYNPSKSNDIPEIWYDTNVPNGENAEDLASNGYTHLENYLNSVEVVTVNRPTITLIGSSNINLNVGDTYTELGATANDSEDGDLTSSIVITGTVDTNTAGIYQVFYNVQDLESNYANQVTRIVVVTQPAAQDNITYPLTTEQIKNNQISMVKLMKYL